MGLDDEIGEELLGDHARWQLDVARSDPRLEWDRPAAGSDFRHAIEEVERTRMLGYLGLAELAGCYERAKRQLDGRNSAEKSSPKQRSYLQGFWERSEMARIELENDAPHLNASALVSLVSALDALIEGMGPALQNILVEIELSKFFDRMSGEDKAEWSEFHEDAQQFIKGWMRKSLSEVFAMPKGRVGSAGAERYESVLRKIGLGKPEDAASIPEDLDDALKEAHSLRNVLVHRAGRIDKKALQDAPTLRFKEGQLVRLTQDDFRRYDAAVRTFGELAIGRAFGPHAPTIDLDRWQENHPVGMRS